MKGTVFLFRHQMSSIKMSFGLPTSTFSHFLEKAVSEKCVFSCQSMWKDNGECRFILVIVFILLNVTSL